jgi:hypothetical protein
MIKGKINMKKILTIVALSLVGLLIVTTIVLGFIPSDFSQLSVTEAYKVTYHKGPQFQVLYKDTNADEFNKLVDLFENQSEQSVLKSLFTGAYSNEPSVKNEATSMTTKLTSGKWLVYRFDNAQTLYINGEKHEDKTQTDPTVTFKKLAMSVIETDGLQEVTMYIFDTPNATTATHTITVYADLTATLEYINNLEII